MDPLEIETNCGLVLNKIGDIGEYKSKDQNVSCLFCSKHCDNSTDFYNSEDKTDLKRVFYTLQINLDDILKQENEAALLICQQCSSVIAKLSSLFKDLEVTKMWINHVLRNLMKIIISGEDDVNNSTDEAVQDDYEKVIVLRELIMEKCISTVNTSAFPQLKLSRCQLPENLQENQYSDDDDRLSTISSLPSSPQSPSFDKIPKLEETEVTFAEKDDTLPTSPTHIFQESYPILEKATTSKSSKIKSKRKPFGFIKPTTIKVQSGQERIHYFCTFCPKSFNGQSAIKFHSISNHPEHIFPSCKLLNLNSNQFRACCFTILEGEVTAVNNEDGVGSFTTYQCKYCPITSKHASSADKRVIQKHQISDHYDMLVEKLKSLQVLQGTKEFDVKVADYLGTLNTSNKIGCSQFKRKWKCGKCARGFPNVKRLEFHKRTCDGSSGGKQMKGYDNEASSTVPKASPCLTCGKIFSCGYSLWRHKRLSCINGFKRRSFKQKEGPTDAEIIKNEIGEDLLSGINNEDPLILSSEPSSSSSQPTRLEKIVKLEETDVTFVEEYDTLPSSPPPQSSLFQDIQMPPSPLPVSPPEIDSNRKPFWFVKPTHQSGVKRSKYFCIFCPKSFNGSNCIKFHSINHHPEHIFASHNISELTSEQFRACCSTILEEEVIPISNEDGVGSFTTYQCKYCPATAKSASHCDKRFIQKHLISDHYDVLVGKLEDFQGLKGTKIFEEKVGEHLGKPIGRRKVLSNQFKRKWKCDACGRGFPNVKRMEVHVMTCDALTGEKTLKGKIKHESGNTAPKPSPCDTCGKVLSSGFSLWRHKRLRCLKGLRKKIEKLNGGDGDDVEYVEIEMEEEILPDVLNDEDPLM